MSSLKSLLGAGGGVQINQDIFLNSTAAMVTEGDQVFLRSGYVSDDLSTYPDATQTPGTITYDNKSFSVTQDADPFGVAFSSDGTKMYVVGYNNSRVYQYTLSTAWDVSTASYASKASSSLNNVPRDVTFSSDGTKMYVVGSSNDTIYQYTLSTAWDVSTESSSNSFYVGSQESNPEGVRFSSDGTKMYVVGNSSDTVYQYTLSTAWDVSTASYSSKSFYVGAQDATSFGLHLSSNGTRMYILGHSNDTVYHYDLATAWDVSTANYANNSFSVATQETLPSGITFSSDDTKMYVVGSSSDRVYQYTSPVVVGLSTEHTRGNAKQYVRVK